MKFGGTPLNYPVFELKADPLRKSASPELVSGIRRFLGDAKVKKSNRNELI